MFIKPPELEVCLDMIKTFVNFDEFERTKNFMAQLTKLQKFDETIAMKMAKHQRD